MNFEYFRVNLTGLPDSILKRKGRARILHLRVGTLRGQVEIEFRHGEVIRTDDWKASYALKHYSVPRVGIKHKPKGEKEFRHVYHDHEEFKHLKVFKRARKTDKFKYEIKA